MKKILIATAIIIIALIGIWILLPNGASSGNKASNSNEDSSTIIAQKALENAKNGRAFIYDVRTPEEFSEKHVETAINHDVEKMQAGTFPSVPKDSTIYVYCRSGNRSNQAKELMQQNGFTNVTDLGGLSDMQKAGIL